MLRLGRSAEARRLCCTSRAQYGWRRSYSAADGRTHDPLNILFCGSDEFSIFSLRALRELQTRKPEKIASIDVVCRPDKYVGRGLKRIQEVPIKSVATQLGLGLHQIDTFKGWQPPASIDLVVAVSFGLLVPARILNGAKYGGLNIHPSLLPDLRGPAPITHALLKRRTHTGVTLQTMHPTKFDHGIILSQTPSPGVPILESSTQDDLIHTLGPIGADILCDGIENGLFIEPEEARLATHATAHLDHAPKITPEEREIRWNFWTSDEMLLRDRVLGRLWDMKSYLLCFGSRDPKRVAFDGPWQKVEASSSSYTEFGPAGPGQMVLLDSGHSKRSKLGFKTCDGQILVPSACTIDGQKKGTGVAAFINHLTR